MNEIERILNLKKGMSNECWLTSQLKMNLERAYARRDLIQELSLKLVYFDDCKQCKNTMILMNELKDSLGDKGVKK